MLRAIGSLLSIFIIAVPLAISAPAAESDHPAEVQLAARGYGWIMSDVRGMTLYTYMRDPIARTPVCTDACLETWPPLKAPVNAQSNSEWSVVDRGDGTRQWAFRGKPLYTYSRDITPGDMNGDEYQRQWYVAVKPVPVPPSFGTYKSPNGYLLVDQRKMTLYTSAVDSANESTCKDACAKIWQPVEAWWRAQSTLEGWSVFDRADGTKQWAYKGQPLYRYAGDYAPGEMAGDGRDEHTAVILESPQPVPDWITYQNSDAGPLLADASGKTLYAHDLTEGRAFGIGISRDMATPHLWTPVAAEGERKPIGHWSVVALDDGGYQWAYKGLKLYVHKRDTQPGDLNGQRSSDRYWRTIMKDGQVMPGSGR